MRVRRHQTVRLSRHVGLRYVIRFRAYIMSEPAMARTRPAAAWVAREDGPQAAQRRGHGGRHKVGAVVCVRARDMKEAGVWHEQRRGDSARDHELLRQRWTIEPGFRDTKDLRFGMGLSVLRIADPQRRDKAALLNAFAIVLLTLLGAAGESPGMTVHSGQYRPNIGPIHCSARMLLYELIPNMPEAVCGHSLRDFRRISGSTPGVHSNIFQFYSQ